MENKEIQNFIEAIICRLAALQTSVEMVESKIDFLITKQKSNMQSGEHEAEKEKTTED